MKSFAVIGLGRFGSKLATSLYEMGGEVLAIDHNEDIINEIADKVTRAAYADSTSKSELVSLGVGDCDCVVIALGSNFSGSVLSTMLVKSLGVKNVICKAHDDVHKEILEKLGADKVIIPEREFAEKTARMLISPNFLEFIELSDEFGIIEITPPKGWVGKKISELNIRKKYNVNIVAIKDNGKTIVSVSPDYEIQKENKIAILGEYKSLEQIERIK